jgi:lysophospholipase L1-like esterase
MGRTRAAGINLLVATCLVAGLFLAGELAARAWLRWGADDTAFMRYASLRQVRARAALAPDPALRYSPHRYLGFYPTPDHRRGANRHNSLGYRGDPFPARKPPGEFRIVCVGGSTTYTPMVARPEEAYPAQLERALHEGGRARVRVVNAGAEGWASYESLINLALRVVDLEPDLIVVYHGVNDIMARMVYPPGAYRGDNAGSRGPVVTGVMMPAWWEHSSLLRIVAIRAGQATPHAALARTLVRPEPTDVAHEWARQVMEGRYPEGPFEDLGVRELLEANPPVYFARNIRGMVALARAHGAETVLVTFAHTPEKTDSPIGNHPDFVWAYDEMNRILADIAAREPGAYLYDFAAAFPTAPEWWADEVHVNEEGAARKADLIAGYLLETGRVP